MKNIIIAVVIGLTVSFISGYVVEKYVNKKECDCEKKT